MSFSGNPESKEKRESAMITAEKVMIGQKKP